VGGKTVVLPRHGGHVPGRVPSEFGGYPSGDVTAAPGEYDGLPAHGPVNIGPYSVLVFSQTRG
jgi:hypothetical protein